MSTVRRATIPNRCSKMEIARQQTFDRKFLKNRTRPDRALWIISIDHSLFHHIQKNVSLFHTQIKIIIA